MAIKMNPETLVIANFRNRMQGFCVAYPSYVTKKES